MVELEAGEQRVEDGVGVEEVEAEVSDVEWLESGGERSKVDEVFFGGDEGGGVGSLGFRKEIADVGGGVGVVITKGDFVDNLNTGGAEVVKEAARAGNGTESEYIHRRGRRGTQGIQAHGSAEAPDKGTDFPG